MSQLGNVVSIEAGDRDRAALIVRRDALVLAHLELVRSIARSISFHLPATFELDDLISTGYVGLIRAATNYRPEGHGGAPFSAYARPVIHGAIVDSVRRGAYVENTRPSIEALPVPTDTGSWTQPGRGRGGFVGAVLVDGEGDLDRERLRIRLRRAVADLDARHGSVIEWHYKDELKLPEVGRRLGVGKNRASQLHVEAVRAIRDKLAA
jgi:RNA polymerase sigma factor for flagellar operon FliA